MAKKYFIYAECFDKQGRLLSFGKNDYQKTHPMMAHLAKVTGQNHQRVYLHAEVSAILRAKDKPIHKLIVKRFTKDGTPALAKPCPMCQELIRIYNIPVVEHT